MPHDANVTKRDNKLCVQTANLWSPHTSRPSLISQRRIRIFNREEVARYPDAYAVANLEGYEAHTYYRQGLLNYLVRIMMLASHRTFGGGNA